MVNQSKKNERKDENTDKKELKKSGKMIYEKRFDKIYSRNYMKIPKISWFVKKGKKQCSSAVIRDKKYQKKVRKIIQITIVLSIAFLVADVVIKAIEPIINVQCVSMAKGVATKISNEQATAAMANYQYEDLMNVTKDENGNIKLLSSNMIKINQIISDIPYLIQNELDKVSQHKFYIKLGSFTGCKLLAGRGPDIEIKMSTIGHIETDLRSEFLEAGINQTLHRIYLEVKCHVVILTPFHSIEEEIVNQVLLTEGIIVGNIPSTYYNLNGLKQDNFVDLIE